MSDYVPANLHLFHNFLATVCQRSVVDLLHVAVLAQRSCSTAKWRSTPLLLSITDIITPPSVDTEGVGRIIETSDFTGLNISCRRCLAYF